MAVQTATVLKSYFNTGDKPTEAQFGDLIDTITQSRLILKKYIIGVAGTTGCDHLFSSVANSTKQSIQLGGTTIIPAKALILAISGVCDEGLSGVITGDAAAGTTSGGGQYFSEGGTGNSFDDTNDALQMIGGSTTLFPIPTASSVYFSFTPSANWNTITTGKWTIYISYIDQAL